MMNELKSISDLGDVTFEDLSNENGYKYWWGSDLMKTLTYPDIKSFSKVINRATKAMMNMNIDPYENIQQETNLGEMDYKLSRFACYLIAMNADPKKEAVAQAQLYFAEMTRKYELYIQGNEEIERFVFREELKDGNRALASAAKQGEVNNYPRFQNAGYRGLYNMFNYQLANRRGIKKEKLYDYMGRTELAANLFRVVMTEEKIKNMKIVGQDNLERAHFQVGKEIREQVKKNVGKNPEDLPKARRLPEIKKELKTGYKKMIKEDKSNN
ncbi:MAG: hypothetical protein P9X26_07935 [Candidatus Stygibacter frigidus]|nr:hypothetical protein [Candidatus Stygibacter frigidus]